MSSYRVQDRDFIQRTLYSEFSEKLGPDDRFEVTVFQLVPIVDELEAILKCEVDFVDRRAVEMSANYIRRREVLKTARVIYAAS